MLTTIEKAKRMLSIPDEEEEQILMAIMTASERIQQECRRSFKKQIYTDIKSGIGSQYLPLRNYPIHDVSEVKVFGSVVTDFVENEGILYRTCSWPRGEFNIAATYTGGYVLPGDGTSDNPSTLPQPLEYACILYAQSLLREQGVSAERVGDISVTYFNEGESLPFAVKALISPYVSSWG